MHRRLTDALERDIAQWECIRRVLDPAVAPTARALADREVERLRYERAEGPAEGLGPPRHRPEAE